MNKPTVQDIFRRFYPAYLEKYSPSPEQAKAVRNILNCKTGAYGANISVCEDCGAVQIHYNSCRNRCCPMCQAIPKEMWMDARREDVLDAPYFHLVFTVPDILNPVIYSNQKLLYDTLYHAASATIQELTADPKHLGASVGYICILHTWGSEMNFHPHIHTILLGGGLTPKNEWKDNGTEFFLPIWAISKVFRGKYMDELKNLWNTDQLEFHGTAEKYRNYYEIIASRTPITLKLCAFGAVSKPAVQTTLCGAILASEDGQPLDWLVARGAATTTRLRKAVFNETFQQCPSTRDP